MKFDLHYDAYLIRENVNESLNSIIVNPVTRISAASDRWSGIVGLIAGSSSNYSYISRHQIDFIMDNELASVLEPYIFNPYYYGSFKLKLDLYIEEIPKQLGDAYLCVTVPDPGMHGSDIDTYISHDYLTLIASQKKLSELTPYAYNSFIFDFLSIGDALFPIMNFVIRLGWDTYLNSEGLTYLAGGKSGAYICAGSSSSVYPPILTYIPAVKNRIKMII